MSATVVVLLFLLGLALVIKGGDFFVDAASWIAEVSGIPKFLIGATIVSLATTLPELLVSLMASASGSIGIAVGNAVGSVTANVGLIMGISVVCLASAVNRREQAFKFIMMAAAIALLYAFSAGGSLGLFGSVVLLAMFLAYMVESVIGARNAMRGDPGADRPAHDGRAILINAVKFVVGVAGIVAGARL
ncbi:MAG: sodium:calcium antiporter, partial [Clostridia bacterium]|nr:sodium:calcium antiporter [Clostridia bacterium]